MTTSDMKRLRQAGFQGEDPNLFDDRGRVPRVVAMVVGPDGLPVAATNTEALLTTAAFQARHPTTGQKVKSGSVPVVIASDQEALLVEVSPPLPRSSVIRVLNAGANTTVDLGVAIAADVKLAPLLDGTAVNMKNLGTADLLVFNVGEDPTLHAYPIPAGQAVPGDFMLTGLAVRSTAAVKIAFWNGKDAD